MPLPAMFHVCVVLQCYILAHIKRTSSNPLVLHGRHFGWTVFALCNYPALLTAGILRLEELQDSPIEDYLAEVFMELIDSYPGLLACLMDSLEWSNTETKKRLKSGKTAVHVTNGPYSYIPGFQTCVTSLSLVDKEPKDMCSGNTYLHDPVFIKFICSISKNSVLSKIQAKRAALQELAAAHTN
ncbi:uncharacterized protein BJ212DRAFT_1304640 [Suillus subaureus]|uniref:Uncharacterized protein n=1 Tax=Suillus subaureus TaxID=48587 RepID=A0A9P7J5B5_9AGAM|nr:uncharacterized protein BJ212DRAFT_1304640 [Suillus subaureus]KAG1803243.1 hypothetical protein BJ212DRAFT_1304640 [Suillus subaureus]